MKKTLLGVIFITGIFSLAYAEDVDLEKIVVTPTRTEESIKGTVSTLTVYTRKDIEEAKADTIKDLIKETMGLDMVQTGSFGGPVSVFLRGTNANHTQIMIDNVRVYDPISTNAAFDLAHLTLDNIERIEIVEGPQSVLYGSDAVGGVINIITKQGTSKPQLKLLFEGGSYSSHKEAVEASGRIENLSVALSASHFASQGISKLKNTSENDPYNNTSASLRMDYDINNDNNLGLTCRLSDARYEYDNSVGLVDDPNLLGKEQQLLFSSYIKNKISDNWQQKLQFSLMRNYRQDSNDKDAATPNDYLRDWYIGENLQIDWQNTINLSSFDSVVLGFDWQREKGNYYYYTEYLGGSAETHFPKVHSSTKAYYLQNLINLNDTFRFNTGVRLDEHSYAGKKETYKLDMSYLFKTRTKIKASLGTAFKAPTLYQLHALPDPWFGGGNPNLKSETSQTYEFGVDQSLLDNKVKFSLTYFHTQLKNLIDAKYNPDTWLTDQYSNIGRARIYGYESSLFIKPCRKIQFKFGYTWQNPEDQTTGQQLLRRPQNKCFADFKYMPNEKLDFDLKFSYVGKRYDSGYRTLKAYTKLDLLAQYQINPSSQLFIRVENLTDEVYEEIRNYAQCGRSFYGGLELSF